MNYTVINKIVTDHVSKRMASTQAKRDLCVLKSISEHFALDVGNHLRNAISPFHLLCLKSACPPNTGVSCDTHENQSGVDHSLPRSERRIVE